MIFIKVHLNVPLRCGLPVCNEACESGEIHGIECGLFTAAFQKQPPKPDEEKDERILLKPPEILGNADNPVPFYACIGPLRLLLNTRSGHQLNILSRIFKSFKVLKEPRKTAHLCLIRRLPRSKKETKTEIETHIGCEVLLKSSR